MSRRHTRIPPWRKAQREAAETARDLAARQRLGVLFGFDQEAPPVDSRPEAGESSESTDAAASKPTRSPKLVP